MRPARLITLLLCSIFSIQASAQQFNYDAAWKKVQELSQKKQLPASALREVRKIYESAKRNKQDAQLIKSVVYIYWLQQETREDNIILSIKEVEKEITTASPLAAQVFRSLAAGLYWQYVQYNRYQLYNRTNTQGFKKEDISTWTLDDIHKRISMLYLASLEDQKAKLKSTSLTAYDPIIIKGNARYLRPTLFDLLAHDALAYFTNTERDITKPVYAFELNDGAAFLPARAFAAYHFSTRDSLSLHFRALQLYQELIGFHLNDTNPSALIDVDRERLQFAYLNSTHEDKENLYRQALRHMILQYNNAPENRQTKFLLAKWYEEKASGYQPFGDTTYRFYRDSALVLLLPVVKDSSIKNEGWTNSYNLLQQIRKPSLSFEIEKVNLPGLPFRARVAYSKLGQVWLRLISIPEGRKTNVYEDSFFRSVYKTAPLRKWTQRLPETFDLQKHATEIRIDPLPVGKYVLLVSSTENFDPQQTIAAAQVIYSSAISYVNKDKKYFVLNRETGLPLTGAKVQLWEERYDYKSSAYQRTRSKVYTADTQGGFILDAKDSLDRYGHNYLLDISYGADHLFMEDQEHVYYYEPDRPAVKENINTVLFTDRAIYRPGQSVYFKGIFFSSEKTLKDHSVKADYTSVIYLKGPDGSTILDSVLVTTNDFGSVAGSFQIPGTGLNGIYQLTSRENLYYGESFRVEEYKRPRFAVSIEKPVEQYQLNDTVRVSGTAKAYAGNAVSGAQVRYRVVRRPRFFYPWMFARYWMPPSPPMEMAHGETTTDDEGRFTISFPAIPDRKIDTSLHPVFDYEVSVDITDINGETRTGSQTIRAGYQSLLLMLDLPAKVPMDSLNVLNIRTENLNGNFTAAQVRVTITNLLPEQRLIRPRYWARPDRFVMDKATYISYFPHDEYDHETDPSTWQKGKTIIAFNDSTNASGNIRLDKAGITAGYYLVTVETKDSEGRRIQIEKTVEVFDVSSSKFGRPEYLWTNSTEGPVEPGEKARVQIGTAAENVHMTYIIDKVTEKPVIQPEIYNSEKKTYSYTVTEEDRGGYYVTWLFAKDNRFFQYSDFIDVPWTNKDLSIEFETFRDKTEPGNKEEWKLRITGNKKESVAAEMLVSMYDASLDQFVKHEWKQPEIWASNYSLRHDWTTTASFQSVNAYEKSYEETYRTYEKSYDHFIFSDNPSMYLGYGNLDLARPVYRMAAKPPMAAQRGDAGDLRGNAAGIMEVEKSMAPSLQEDTTSVAQDDRIQTDGEPITMRRDFRETAFFYPQLRTDKDGSLSFSFTAPEALTKWKLQAFAHTRDMSMGLIQKEMVTQKPLMVQPNMPRFLRQGDRMELAAKVVNMTGTEMTGQASLELFDAATGQSVDGWFINSFPNQYFTVGAGKSEVVKFPIQVPFQFSSALQWRIVARSGKTSDGEEDILPVLTNKVLVTESLPLWLPEGGNRNFSFDKLLHSDSSTTLQQQGITVEYTSNPSWYVVQALPWLSKNTIECSEQLWNSYYAQSLASYIIRSHPRIREVIQQWNKDTAAVLSPLQKNEELKSAILEETPWVMEALSESEQKKNLYLLFDSSLVKANLRNTLEKLRKLQSPNGGFTWFAGGPDDRYMTQYILTGIGHLKKLGVTINDLRDIIKPALAYLDKKIAEDYAQLKKSKMVPGKQLPAYQQVQYLYMRSFFPENVIPAGVRPAVDYYHAQAGKFWMKQDKMAQGMIALTFFRKGNRQLPVAIMKSLKETAIHSPELGMYWKDNQRGRGWYWWQAPIETQALLIEVFTEAGKDNITADALRTWLIRNKQTNHWPTTKATADACYAFLLRGSNWLPVQPQVSITLGTIEIAEGSTEAGTGYFKTSIEADKVTPSMGNITVSTSTEQKIPGWGAVYWKYFEEMDKVTEASTPLSLHKKLFLSENTDRGPVLRPIDESTELHPGDRIQVRMELRVDRDMEYVHMKDMRASGLEPLAVLSGYKWQGGLGYYESPGDLSTSFFFSFLPRGTYVFEYTLFVSHSGNFTNGITTIQSMYAPEFGAHSEGVRVRVE